ncbi:MAG: hypothetical protein HUU06_08265, partial [Planctomycetaceae bacterium]|nr:hypothetical protein [Planctomycetaceae bacterium]
MTRAETVRALLGRLHAAGGADFVEDPPGSGVHLWRTKAGRRPFEAQVDRFGLEIRCYLADELFCTGRLFEDEADDLLAPSSGPGSAEALAELAAFVDREVAGDSRRFLTPPHADRHPDRR